MRGIGRLARWLAVLLGLAVAGAAGALVWYRHAAQPPVSGNEVLAGLREPVTVVRDRQGVPHIRAASKVDAWFALGYVHAQDRLWQMQMNKRIVAGRLAEILGPSAVDNDKFLRTLGVRRNAEAIFTQASPEARAALQAYADGVNAWIDQRQGPLPPEFLLLRTRPERWEPADTLGWQTMMAWDLGGNWTQETLRMRLAQVLPVARISELLAPYPGEQPYAPWTMAICTGSWRRWRARWPASATRPRRAMSRAWARTTGWCRARTRNRASRCWPTIRTWGCRRRRCGTSRA
ncbi:exported hypothetical protein [Cupriavidus taiwanensis]|nr:exported hypothetical protein [Cupriavidus taiwanensis]